MKTFSQWRYENNLEFVQLDEGLKDIFDDVSHMGKEEILMFISLLLSGLAAGGAGMLAQQTAERAIQQAQQQRQQPQEQQPVQP